MVMKILSETIWGNFLWFDSKCAPLSLKWGAGSWGMISKVTGKRKCHRLWRRRHHDVMIWYLWRLRTSLWHDLESTESRDCFTHRRQSRCHSWPWKPAQPSWPLLGAQQLKDGPTRSHKTQRRLRVSHETGTQKPLCALPLVSPPSAWLTKPGCLSPAHQPRAPPDRDCLWKSLFSSLTVLSGAEAERGAVFFTTMWGKHAASCRSALASVLDSLFSVFLSFSASSLGLSTSQISSVETLRVTPGTQSYSWNTQSAIQRCWVCWECTRLWCWVPCDRMDSWKRFRARQHCCPSCPSWTKDSLPLFWIFDRGSSGASENSDASKSHFEAVSWQKGKWSKENLANAVEKLDLTLTVFLMEVWISIRRQRQRWEKFIFTRGGC